MDVQLISRDCSPPSAARSASVSGAKGCRLLRTRSAPNKALAWVYTASRTLASKAVMAMKAAMPTLMAAMASSNRLRPPRLSRQAIFHSHNTCRTRQVSTARWPLSQALMSLFSRAAQWRWPAIVNDHATLETNNALGLLGDVEIVRHQHQGRPSFPMQSKEEINDHGAGLGIEIAGRFISIQNPGLAYEGACQGDALLLTAGKLHRIVLQPLS